MGRPMNDPVEEIPLCAIGGDDSPDYDPPEDPEPPPDDNGDP